jgi:hypothetical protein
MAAKNRHNPIDCLGSALPDEEYFVLLARDPAFPALLAIWSSLRVGNVTAAAENFTMLMTPELVAHYRMHPDIAKSEEAIATANRGMEWRNRNLTTGPHGTPSWKSSPVRPQMIDLVALELDPTNGGERVCPVCYKHACECDTSPAAALNGLRELVANMRGYVSRDDVEIKSEDHGFALEAMDQYADKLETYANRIEGIGNARIQ